MEKPLNKAIDTVISCIVDSYDYQMCLQLKEQMSNNSDLVDLMETIKKQQKQYVQSQYDEGYYQKLEELTGKLEQIPLYVVYSQYLENVNRKISWIIDELNDYFYCLLNGK